MENVLLAWGKNKDFLSFSSICNQLLLPQLVCVIFCKHRGKKNRGTLWGVTRINRQHTSSSNLCQTACLWPGWVLHEASTHGKLLHWIAFQNANRSEERSCNYFLHLWLWEWGGLNILESNWRNSVTKVSPKVLGDITQITCWYSYT